MKPFEQEQGDQGCPNLDAEGVFAGADEGLYGEILFQGFENSCRVRDWRGARRPVSSPSP